MPQIVFETKLCPSCGLELIWDEDPLNLTVAVGKYTVQVSAETSLCPCGYATTAMTNAIVNYHTVIKRESDNSRKDWETEQDIELGWEDKDN